MNALSLVTSPLVYSTNKRLWSPKERRETSICEVHYTYVHYTYAQSAHVLSCVQLFVIPQNLFLIASSKTVIKGYSFEQYGVVFRRPNNELDKSMDQGTTMILIVDQCNKYVYFVSVPSCVQLFVTPWL